MLICRNQKHQKFPLQKSVTYRSRNAKGNQSGRGKTRISYSNFKQLNDKSERTERGGRIEYTDDWDLCYQGC